MPVRSNDPPSTRHRNRLALCAVLAASIVSMQAQQNVPAPATSRTQTRTVHSRVVADDNGNALPNARLVVDADEGRASAASDGDGRFALTAPANATTLSVSKAGFTTARVPIGDGMEIRLPRGAAIVGHVTDDGGGPLPLMVIVAERRRVVDGRVRFERQTAGETDDTGTYRLFDLPAGDYVIGRSRPRVILAAPGRVVVPVAVEEAPRDYFPHTTRPEEAQVLSLVAGSETAGIDFTVAVPPLSFTPVPQPVARRDTLGTIRGRVCAATVRRCAAPASRHRPPDWQRALSGALVGMGSERTTTDHGAFAFGNLTPASTSSRQRPRATVYRERASSACSSSPSAATMSAT